jgi:hypothetical protein
MTRVQDHLRGLLMQVGIVETEMRILRMLVAHSKHPERWREPLAELEAEMARLTREAEKVAAQG